MKNKMLMIALGFTGAMIANLTFYSIVVMAEADNTPSTDNLGRYIPYDGYLELDGEAVSADDMAMRFTIYDDDDNALWNEELTVNIYNGKFAVLLGQTSDITSTVFDAEDIFIGAELFDNNQWIDLSGRQLITPVPFALWAGQGSQFVVAGHLKINGSDLKLGLDDGRSIGDNTAQRALVHGDSDTLYVNYDGDFEGGTIIGSGLTVSGSVSSGAITSSGTISSSDNLFAGGTSGGALPSWFSDTNTHGIKVFGGTDNAFFGVRNRSDDGDSNSYDAVIYFGDDTSDSLIFATQDNGDVATMSAGGSLSISGTLSSTGADIDGVDNDGDTAALKISAGTQVMLIGGNEIDSNGTLHFQNNSESETKVHGDLRVENCRICLNYADDNADDSNDKKYACVRMVPDSRSGTFNLLGDVNDDDLLELVFRCDGGSSTTGTGWVGH